MILECIVKGTVFSVMVCVLFIVLVCCPWKRTDFLGLTTVICLSLLTVSTSFRLIYFWDVFFTNFPEYFFVVTEEIELTALPQNITDTHSFPFVPEAPILSREKYAAKNLGTE